MIKIYKETTKTGLFYRSTWEMLVQAWRIHFLQVRSILVKNVNFSVVSLGKNSLKTLISSIKLV